MHLMCVVRFAMCTYGIRWHQIDHWQSPGKSFELPLKFPYQPSTPGCCLRIQCVCPLKPGLCIESDLDLQSLCHPVHHDHTMTEPFGIIQQSHVCTDWLRQCILKKKLCEAEARPRHEGTLLKTVLFWSLSLRWDDRSQA